MSDEQERLQRAAQLQQELRAALERAASDVEDALQTDDAEHLSRMADEWALLMYDELRKAVRAAAALATESGLQDEAAEAAFFKITSTEHVLRALTKDEPLAWLTRVATNRGKDALRSDAARRRRETAYEDDQRRRWEALQQGDSRDGRYLAERLSGYESLWQAGERTCPWHGAGHASAGAHLGVIQALRAETLVDGAYEAYKDSLEARAVGADAARRGARGPSPLATVQRRVQRELSCREWLSYDAFVGRPAERLQYELFATSAGPGGPSRRAVLEEAFRARLRLAGAAWDVNACPAAGAVYLHEHYPHLLNHIDAAALELALAPHRGDTL